MSWEDAFRNPPRENRIHPFWFWNGDITLEEIEHQIEEMAEKGLGGMFICPRQGQTVPYLSKKWFELIEFACQKADENGLESWLYDEYPYPSGMSGGEVLLRHPEAGHMVLHHYAFQVEGGIEFIREMEFEEILYAAAVPVVDGLCDLSRRIDLKENIGNLQQTEIYQKTGLTAYNNKRFFTYGPKEVLVATLPEGHWKVEIYAQAALGDFKYYGGFFDPCNPQAVRTFLETTHEKYAKQIGNRFGSTVMGMFSDEVGMLSPIPWSRRVPEEFEKRKGYSLLDNLPALHDNTWENVYKIRYDLYDVIHQIFVESYHKQVADWCQAHRLSYAAEVPFMRLSTQRYSTIPGGDTAHEKAGKSLEWIYNKYLRHFRYSANAVGSLAKQLDRNQALIESFHSVGWTMTMQDAKWMIDRLGCSGINMFNFHAFYYTIDSIAKHDAPPSQFLQNPYWKEYRRLADYVGRMSVFVSASKATCSIAVLDPAPTLWSLLGDPFQGFPYEGEDPEEEKLCDQIRDDWVYITKTILLNQLQYDHLDSEMLPQFEVKNGRLEMGRASYGLVIIPPAFFYEREAFKKLREFIVGGGQLLFLGRLPDKSLDMEISDEEMKSKWELLVTEYPEQVTFLQSESAFKEAGMEEAMIRCCKKVADEPFEICLKEDFRKEFITSFRVDDKGNVYALVANQGLHYVEAAIKSKRKDQRFAVEQYCLDTGEKNLLGIIDDVLSLEFAPLESKCICFTSVGYSEAVLPSHLQRITIGTQEPMLVEISGGNILRFEQFQMSLDQVYWTDTEVKTFIEQCAEQPVLKAEQFRFESDFGTPKQAHIQYPVNVFYRTVFQIKELPESLSLLLDKRTITGEYVISINGIEIRKADFKRVFINDQNNRICEITRWVALGKNTISVDIAAGRESDGIRDPLYLTGDFGVNERRELIKKPETAHFSICFTEGFPYYSGILTFTKKVCFIKQEMPETFLLDFDFKNTCLECLEVKINGHSLGVRAYTPYQWECKRLFLKNGENTIDIVRINTLANMLDGTYFDYEKHKLIPIYPPKSNQ